MAKTFSDSSITKGKTIIYDKGVSFDRNNHYPNTYVPIIVNSTKTTGTLPTVMNYFDNDKFFIYMTKKILAKQLMNFNTINRSKEYWNAIINIINKNGKQTDVQILTEIKMNNDELAYYIDSNYKIIENFLPFDNARINSLINENIAPYHAVAIGIFKIVDDKPVGNPHAFVIINGLKQTFGKRLYRVGLMSDIHYNDTDISDHTDVIRHYDGGGEYIADITKAFKWYEDKEFVDFVCASGDVTTDNMAHLINFRTMIKQQLLKKNFFTCFGNHDYKATANYNEGDTIYDEYEDEEIQITDKTRLQVWNSILIPKKSPYEIHYQDPTTEYGKTSYWFEVPTTNGKSDIYAFLSVNYLREDNRHYINPIDTEITWHQMYRENISIDIIKPGYNSDQKKLQTTPDYNIVLQYSDAPQRFGFDYHHIENYTKRVRIKSFKITDANDIDVTSQIDINDPKIGVYGTDERYHVVGECEGKIFENNGINNIEIPISSSFRSKYPDIQFPIKLFLNIDIASGTNTEKPEVNETSTANYKLTEDSPYMQDVISYVGYMPKSYNIKFYDNAALLWLKDLLESHPKKRIFIFTHQFFPQKAGNNNAYGYEYGMDNNRITPDSAYCLCGIQFEFLNKLNNQFKNTIWFTGHSHYDFDTQITDNTTTLCHKDFAIYRPDDVDFDQSRRYHRRNVKLIDLADFNNKNMYECYRKDTYEHIDTKMLWNRVNIPNGQYKVTLFANSVYTPDRGFESPLFDDGNFNPMSVASIYCTVTDALVEQKIQLVSRCDTKLTNYSIDEMKYEFIVNVTNGFFEVGIIRDAVGTNWYTAMIAKIENTDNQEDITDTLIINKWKDKDNNNAKHVPDIEILPEEIRNLIINNDNDIIRQVYLDKQKDAIITNTNTGYNIHIPSTSRPLASNYGKNHKMSVVGNYDSALKENDSAGIIMDIYEDYVDIRGISFKLNDSYPNEYINKYHPLGQYRIPIKSA